MKKSNYITPEATTLLFVVRGAVLTESSTGNEIYNELGDQGDLFQDI